MPGSRKQTNFCFTLFDYNEWTPPLIDERVRYLCFGEEKCPTTGRPHLQGFICYTKPTLLRDAQAEDFDNRAALKVARGTVDQNIEYCSKDGIFTEFGDRPVSQSGTVEQLVDDIKSNKTTVERVVLEMPNMYHRYGRTLERAQDLVLANRVRDFIPTVHWLYGPTGCGKTRKAVELAGESVYWYKQSDRGWQDGYFGQSSLIIDDFRGSIPYDELLRMLDRYPYELSRRGRMPVPLLAKTIIITSSLPPEQVYKRRNEQDSIAQLLRRITHLKNMGEEVGGWQGNIEPANVPEFVYNPI